MVIFQFPSTAIAWSPHVFFRKTGMVLGSGRAVRRYSASCSPNSTIEPRRSSAGGRANPVGDEDAKRDILHGKGRDLRPDCDHRHIECPQLEIAGRGDRDHAGAEREHQRGPGVARGGDIMTKSLSPDWRAVAADPAPRLDDPAAPGMPERGTGPLRARILSPKLRAA